MAPIKEVLLSTRTRFHDLVAPAAVQQATRAIAEDNSQQASIQKTSLAVLMQSMLHGVGGNCHIQQQKKLFLPYLLLQPFLLQCSWQPALRYRHIYCRIACLRHLHQRSSTEIGGAVSVSST